MFWCKYPTFLSQNKIVVKTKLLENHAKPLGAQLIRYRDGNGLDLIQDPRDPNPIGSDLDRFKMDLDRIWISMCGSKMNLEQIWIYLNI